jgi:ABC-type lipoprotein release transport system permease subunit
MSTIETTTGGSRVLHALGSFARARETSILIALILSFLATLYPAWKAASTDPVQVLRYE